METRMPARAQSAKRAPPMICGRSSAKERASAMPKATYQTAALRSEALRTSRSRSPNATEPCVITIIDDLLDEWDEEITLTITSASGALVGAIDTHTLTIVDGDPLPVVSFLDASPASLLEGGTGVTRTVRLDAPSGRTVTVPLIAGGSATAGLDHTITPSLVTFDPGITAVAVTVAPIDDPIDEPNESISLTLGPPTNAVVGAPGTVTLTLVDDDGLPEVSFASASSSVGETGGLVTLTATLSVPSSTAITVPLSLGGTATANVDYAIAPTTLQFAVGSTSTTATVIIIDDARSEDDETIAVSLAATGGAAPAGITTHTITLLDDDPLPTVSLGAAALELSEGSGTSTLAVRLGVPAGRDVSVTVTTTGTAESGIDLVAVPTLVTIPAGATETLLPITVIDDGEDEPDETRTITIAPTGTASPGTPASCVVTILDDDAPPTIGFSPVTTTGTEGNTVTLTAQLSAPSGFAISVPVTGAGTATNGSDLVLSGATIDIPAGALGGSLALDLVADGLFEGTETWTATLGAAPRVTLGATASATVTILDGDAPPSVSFSTAVLSLTEGNGLVRVGIDLSGPSQSDQLIGWSTSGTATVGTDLVVAPNPVLVPAGSLTANLTIIVIQDVVAEPTEGVAHRALPAGRNLARDLPDPPGEPLRRRRPRAPPRVRAGVPRGRRRIGDRGPHRAARRTERERHRRAVHRRRDRDPPGPMSRCPPPRSSSRRDRRARASRSRSTRTRSTSRTRR